MEHKQFRKMSSNQAGYLMTNTIGQHTGIPGNPNRLANNPQFNVKAATRNMSRQSNGQTESNVVKSLLTGQKYVQQSTNGPTRTQMIPKIEENNLSQQIQFSDLPSDLAPGEKLFALLDGVPYEIITGPNQEIIAQPAGDNFTNAMAIAGGNGISLEDLANISAEQETLKLVDSNGSLINQTSTMSLPLGNQNNHQNLQNNNVSLIQKDSIGGMQIIVMPDGQQRIIQNSSGLKIGGNEIVLQPGQQLPQELQDMITRGGLDLSNYEFVIQDEEGNQQQSQQVYQYDASMLQEMLQHNQQNNSNLMGVGSNDVLALLAEASSAVSSQQNQDVIENRASYLMAPEDEDDGEFVFVSRCTELDLEELSQSLDPIKIHDGYLQAFKSYIQGNKAETLASVANSTIIKKPPLPQYIPEFCPRKQPQNFKQRKNHPSLTYSNNINGSSAVNMGISTNENLNFLSSHSKKDSKIVGKRTKNSDDESYDGSELEAANGSDSDSDPGWKPASENSKKMGTYATFMIPKISRGRGRGRPRGSGRGTISNRGTFMYHKSQEEKASTTFNYIGNNSNVKTLVATASAIEIGNSSLMSSDPHFYHKGDFVLERKDAYKCEGFPIWKIEAGRLLQKFDPVQTDKGLLHKSASIYSSWSGDIRTSFKAIMVDLVNTTGRRQEMVKIWDDYLPKPHDETLEQDALIDLFNIYVQNLVSQSLDSTFMSAIISQHEEYYMGPLRQIDSLLIEAEQTITSQITWSSKFKETIEALPYYRLTEHPYNPDKYFCMATEDGVTPAIKTVNFFGPIYSSDILETLTEVDITSSENFQIGLQTLELFVTYHSLHHFKYLLYKNSQEEVNYKRLQYKDKSDEFILGDCLQNRVWVQQHLRALKDLLAKCTIVVTVVTKSEDDVEQHLQEQQQLQLHEQMQLDQQVSQNHLDTNSFKHMNYQQQQMSNINNNQCQSIFKIEGLNTDKQKLGGLGEHSINDNSFQNENMSMGIVKTEKLNEQNANSLIIEPMN